jgi:predicted RNase H-like HicB family nuclease
LKVRALANYHIIIERGPTNFCAYAPDLPGCVAAHKTLRGVKAFMKEAIELHLAGMKDDSV